jgi:DNA-binding NarL/FixJ family response regulator
MAEGLEHPLARSVLQTTARDGQAVQGAMLRILIADDIEVERSGLRLLLEARPGWDVVAEAADGREAIRKAVKLKPDVAILEHGLPSMIEAAEATRQIRTEAPNTEILILASRSHGGLIRAAFAAGARGYVLKSDSKHDLYAAVASVARHQPFVTASVPGTGDGTERDPLTSRELAVVKLIAEGSSNKAIARRLNVSIKTIETHRAAAIRKLGFTSSTGLVRYAIRHQLVGP